MSLKLPSPFVRLRSPVALAALAALLLALLGLAYLGYSAYKKRELQASVLALVDLATARVAESLAPADSTADTLERLEAHLSALESANRRLAALEGWRDPPLAERAGRYLGEAQALLRRVVALRRGYATVLGALDALTGHIAAARWRSRDWIREALALKQAMERDYFEFRLVEGGLRKSLRSLPEARDQLAPLVAQTRLVEDGALSEAGERLDKSVTQLAARVDAARTLPVPR